MAIPGDLLCQADNFMTTSTRHRTIVTLYGIYRAKFVSLLNQQDFSRSAICSSSQTWTRSRFSKRNAV